MERYTMLNVCQKNGPIKDIQQKYTAILWKQEKEKQFQKLSMLVTVEISLPKV